MALEFAGADFTDTTLTTLTSGAGAGTKGSYTELIGTTTNATSRMVVQVSSITAKEHFQIWIAKDSAPEVDIHNFTYWGGSSDGTSGGTNYTFEIPIEIDASTRISAACASSAASKTVEIAIALSDDSSYGTSDTRETIGISGGGFNGTDIDPGAFGDTLPGTWTELAASTGHAYDMMIVSIGMSDNNALAYARWIVQIGIDSGGGDTLLVDEIYHVSDTGEDGHKYYTIYAPVGSGDQVVARCQCNITDPTDRVIDVSLTGIKMTAPSGGGATQTSYGYFG